MSSEVIGENGTSHRAPAGVQAAWEACWEIILTLPTGTVPLAELPHIAEHAVRSCRRRTRSRGMTWMAQELNDARDFVAEQLTENPQDSDWVRIMNALDGAYAGLKRASKGSTAWGRIARIALLPTALLSFVSIEPLLISFPVVS
jgi:hypothetical protein